MYIPRYVGSKAVDRITRSRIHIKRCALRTEPEEVSRSPSSCEHLLNLHYRGPAKGYLSALEEEKHQMEALIGTLLASQDPRARTLVQDIAQDPLAREVLSRVDRSIVGTQGRLQGAGRWPDRIEASKSGRVGKRMTGEMASSTYEWQDHLLHIIATSPSAAATFPPSSASPSRLLPGPHCTSVSPVQPGYHPSPPEHHVHARDPLHHTMRPDPGSIHPSLALRNSHPSLHSAYAGYPHQNHALQAKPGPGPLQMEVLQPFSIQHEEVSLESPRQRRRIDNSMVDVVRKLRHAQSAHSLDGRPAVERLSWAGGRSHQSHGKPSSGSPSFCYFGLTWRSRTHGAQHPKKEAPLRSRRHASCQLMTLLIPKIATMPWANSVWTTTRRYDTMAKRVACTSLDRHCEMTLDKRVAYGKWRKGVGRSEHGIGFLVYWLTNLATDRRFPPARVWPPIEPANHRRRIRVEDYGVRLPSKERQAFLLQLFFAYVNTSLPLFKEEPFMDAWRRSVDDLYVKLKYSAQSTSKMWEQRARRSGSRWLWDTYQTVSHSLYCWSYFRLRSGSPMTNFLSPRTGRCGPPVNRTSPRPST
jgi:hypothetical protein